jgi:hypothetical protein
LTHVNAKPTHARKDAHGCGPLQRDLADALHYEQLFYLYMGGTLVLGFYLAYAGFST